MDAAYTIRMRCGQQRRSNFRQTTIMRNQSARVHAIQHIFAIDFTLHQTQAPAAAHVSGDRMGSMGWLADSGGRDNKRLQPALPSSPPSSDSKHSAPTRQNGALTMRLSSSRRHVRSGLRRNSVPTKPRSAPSGSRRRLQVWPLQWRTCHRSSGKRSVLIKGVWLMRRGSVTRCMRSSWPSQSRAK